MPGEELASPVRELLAVPQVEPLDVVAVLGKRGQGRVPHCLLVGQGDHQMIFNSIFTWHPFKLRLFKNPPHLRAKFSTTVPSTSTCHETRMIVCIFLLFLCKDEILLRILEQSDK